MLAHEDVCWFDVAVDDGAGLQILQAGDESLCDMQPDVGPDDGLTHGARGEVAAGVISSLGAEAGKG